MVVRIEAVIAGQNDVVAALKRTVLERIVQYHHIHIRSHRLYLVYAAYTVLTYSHTHIRELQVQLHRLVAYRLGGRLGISHHKSLGRTLVTTRQHSHLILLAQQVDQVLHMGSLACASHGDVTHTDGRYIDFRGTEHVLVIEHMS